MEKHIRHLIEMMLIILTVIGDNRDCSKDSRFLSEVGYVHEDNLVGKAQILFFSSDPRIGSIFNLSKWKNTIRINRFFKKIK